MKIKLFFIGVFLQVQILSSSDFFENFKKLAQNTFNLVTDEKILPTSRSSVSANSLVLKYNQNDVGVKKIIAWRIDSDTVLVIKSENQDGSQTVFVSSNSLHNYLSQLQSAQNFVNSSDCKNSSFKAVILAAIKDRDRDLPASPIYTDQSGKTLAWPKDQTFWENYQTMLQALGVKTKIVTYCMVPGAHYRDRNHLEVEVRKNEVFWRSAIDGFVDHKL